MCNIADIEDQFSKFKDLIPDDMKIPITNMVTDLIEYNDTDYDRLMYQLKRKYRISPKKSQMLYIFKKCNKQNIYLEEFLISNSVRRFSGVMVIAVLTSPYPEYTDRNGKIKKQRFSCKKNCYYCPSEIGQPRSYLKHEPAVQRANRNDFDPVRQFNDRATTYLINGHPVDKIELIVLGGTWSEYPAEYQEYFVKMLFYAANTFYDTNKREPLDMESEHKLNEDAKCKIIGLTLETRPDSITPEEIIRFRYFGCTRIQIGVQHTDDEILRRVNRGCYLKDTIRAIQLLKDACYKIDIHLMPDLPFSSPEKDKKMFDMVLNSPDLQVDQWKIYPCEIVPWTIIKKWYENGTYKPYSHEDLIDVILDVKTKVHPWIRLNRVIRDIPNEYIIGGNNVTNLRQYLIQMLKDQGKKCKCIRCREVRYKQKFDGIKLIVRQYESSGGQEYFISYESLNEETIFGFLRLRLSKNAGIGCIKEIENSALIRELHVYGKMMPTDKRNEINGMQHRGYGKKLMKKAEEIAIRNGYNRMAVISGIGVKNYYRKIGYHSEGTFMVKNL